jgi:hypothetical protein
VSEDRYGGSPFDDSLNQAQGIQQCCSLDDQSHELFRRHYS